MANRGEPGAGVYVKVERAKGHIRDLTSAIRAFLDSEPYEVNGEEEPETGDLSYRIQVLREMPLECSAVLGDAVHNLRSALDLLACELVIAGGGKVTEQTGFPIGKDVNAVKSMLKARLNGAPQDAIKVITALNPYAGGNDPLWWLHRLDIADKHRLLLTVGSAYKNFVINASWMVSDEGLRHIGLDDAGIDEFRKMPAHIAINPADRQ